MDWVGFASLPSLSSTFHAPAADAGRSRQPNVYSCMRILHRGRLWHAPRARGRARGDGRLTSGYWLAR